MVTKNKPSLRFIARCSARSVAFFLTVALLCTSAIAEENAADPPAAEDETPLAEKQFEEMPIQDLKTNWNTVSSILGSGKFEGSQQQTFDDYYQKYFFPSWTHKDSISNIPTLRRELRIRHLGKKSIGGGTAVHDHLNLITLDFMKQLVDGPYDPAVQLNAMLMIGDLNSVEQPPTPLPGALPFMVEALNNAKTSDAVRVAALVGIQRHLMAGPIAEEVRPALLTGLMKSANAEISAGPAAAGQEWLLAQSIETLGLLGGVGDGNAVFKAIMKALENPKLSLSTRTIAAETLSSLNYSNAQGIKAADVAASLAQFAIDSCTSELNLYEKNGQPIPRRRMKQYLDGVLKALTGDGKDNHKGIGSIATTPEAKALVAELQKEIEVLTNAFDEKRNEGEDMDKDVASLKEKLEALLSKKPN